MKSNNELNKERLYEVTEVEIGTTWYEPLDDDACVVGTIVRPKGDRVGNFTVIKKPPSGFLTLAAESGENIYFGPSLTLRPLNNRDQEKIMRRWNQLCLSQST